MDIYIHIHIVQDINYNYATSNINFVYIIAAILTNRY